MTSIALWVTLFSFAALASSIGLTLIVRGRRVYPWIDWYLVYAAGYMAGVERRERLFLLLCGFMVAMLGCVMADDLFLLFIFWELTSITSYLLVGHAAASRTRSGSCPGTSRIVNLACASLGITVLPPAPV